jgi:GlpG protein
MIGHLPGSNEAQIFGDFLVVQGIDNQVEADSEGTWAVWVHSEDDLARATQLLGEFLTNPADLKYRRESAGAAKIRAKQEQSNRRYQRKILDGSILWRSTATYRHGVLTVGMIVFCGAIFFLMNVSADHRWMSWLQVSENPSPASWHARWLALTELRQGQLWRLVTPVFLHFGFLHLFFNMLWLLDLGSMIEARLGTTRWLLLFAGLAVFSNLAQYFVSGPSFGGMSGVVYGLLGYIWIRGKFDVTSGLFLQPGTVTMMIIWFFLCLLGLMGPVANTAHAAGLGLGMAWGFATARMRSHR